MRAIASFQDEFKDIWHYDLFQIEGTGISVGNICAGGIVLLIGIKISSILSRRLTNHLLPHFSGDKKSLSTYQKLLYYLFNLFFIFLALKISNVPLTAFAVVGSALAIGIGFGSQNIVSNFISGLIIMVEKPIKIGDTIEIEEVSGIIQSIGTRSTKILTAGNKFYILPNSMLLEKKLLNWTLNNPTVRTSISFLINVDTDIHEVSDVLTTLALKNPKVYRNPAPSVTIDDITLRGLKISLNFSADQNQLGEIAGISCDLRKEIVLNFKARGFKFSQAADLIPN